MSFCTPKLKTCRTAGAEVMLANLSKCLYQCFLPNKRERGHREVNDGFAGTNRSESILPI